MMRAALVLLCLAANANAATLSFPEALERAKRARGAEAFYEQHAQALETLSARTLPAVRAETGISTAEDLNLITQNVDRFDAVTALVSVDYPLFTGGAAARRSAVARADAQLLRQRASDESEELFLQTLDAFAALYLAGQRIEQLRHANERAAALRDRAATMLAAGTISNLTAAQWQDQALAAESQRVDLELQRLDAETRLKQLIGDTSAEPLQASLDTAALVTRDPGIARATILEERKRLALQDALAQRKPQVMLSAFGGVAALPDRQGTFGLYGLRFTLSLPMFDAAAARRIADARFEAEETARARTVAAAAAQHRADLLRVSIDATDKRIALLEEAIGVSRRREESVTRLVRAGVRVDADLLDVANASSRRESDLLAARVERWKLEQRLRWHSGSD